MNSLLYKRSWTLLRHQANADLEKEIILHGKEQFLIDQDLANHINGAPLIVETTTEVSAVEVGIVDIYTCII